MLKYYRYKNNLLKFIFTVRNICDLPNEICYHIVINYIETFRDKYLYCTSTDLFLVGDCCYRITSEEVEVIECNQRISQVVCGSAHWFYKTADGYLGYGSNHFGQLNIGLDIKRLACCNNTSVYLTKENEVYGCGYSNNGQFGEYKYAIKSPKLLDVTNVIDIKCGAKHIIFITTHGLYGSGSNSDGQLGLGDIDRCIPHKIDIHGEVLNVVCGSYHTMILTTNGLFAFGKNNVGQLGLDHNDDVYTPTKLDIDITNMIDICCGHYDSFLFFKAPNGISVYGAGKYSNSSIFRFLNINNIIDICCSNNNIYILTKNNLYINQKVLSNFDPKILFHDFDI